MKKLLNWIKSFTHTEVDLYKVEKAYRDFMSPIQQKEEDDFWERDIERCAQEMYNDYIKFNSTIIEEQRFKLPHVTFIPLTKKHIYTVYHKETAKYLGCDTVHKLIMERYNELIKTNPDGK